MTPSNWHSPEAYAKGRATRRAQRIKALGTTEERMAAPLLDRKGRAAYLKGLFLEGKTMEEVIALHPRESYQVLWNARNKAHLERVRALEELL